MGNRIQDLIEQLELRPHPEGGYYREIFRSSQVVKPLDLRTERNALTAIYFLLSAEQCSRWHSVLSDEIWCHLEGAPLDLFCFEAQSGQMTCVTLGKSFGQKPMYVVAAGVWQAAIPKGEYVLAGCYVGPGFDFQDFRLATDEPEIARAIQERGAEFGKLL